MNTWKKQLRKVGFRQIDRIQRISEAVVKDPKGGLYRAVIVYWRKGNLRGRLIVDTAFMNINKASLSTLVGEIVLTFWNADHAVNVIHLPARPGVK